MVKSIEGEYEIAKILRARKACPRRRKGIKRGPPRFEYLVRWHGYGIKDSTWEPAEHLPDGIAEQARKIVDEKKQKAPDNFKGAFSLPNAVRVIQEWIVDLDVETEEAVSEESVKQDEKETDDAKPESEAVKPGKRAKTEKKREKKERKRRGPKARSSSSRNRANKATAEAKSQPKRKRRRRTKTDSSAASSSSAEMASVLPPPPPPLSPQAPLPLPPEISQPSRRPVRASARSASEKLRMLTEEEAFMEEEPSLGESDTDSSSEESGLPLPPLLPRRLNKNFVKKVLSIRLDGALVMLPVSIMALPSKPKKAGVAPTAVAFPVPVPAAAHAETMVHTASVIPANSATSAPQLRAVASRPPKQTPEPIAVQRIRVEAAPPPYPVSGSALPPPPPAPPSASDRWAQTKKPETTRKKARYRVTAGCLVLMIPFYVTRTVNDLIHEVTVRVRRHRLYPKLIEDINSKLHPSDQRKNLRVSQLSREKGGPPLNLLNAIGLTVEPESSLHATLIAVTH
mmetsp:Transcript_20645/g.38838  ORF Transcript_20645/g.38838 Transcript_20645/m.38838 type:complete len:513 (-) Transcript_20645:107-1645(-)|eukprot:CAMPEP_0170190218 /NCGR_PEP_ID=MMETSP0040_2-20121228/48848_1 /TAXON_ID=641309 /ORGANISM="Lotharella oceanica, Strain CCMP622" /LENGTH=512 /DNA_ID=CAMNT_0010438033 /DNA_START=33 /DNA_END=1571 /DNA_ORIENTATION=+